MEKKDLLNTREVANFLDVNEKVVYNLITERGLPASKVTGKWLFPRHLVEKWLEKNTINYPRSQGSLAAYQGLLILSGSNDILLDRTISLFNRLYTDHVAVFGNVGSLGGLSALARGLCHIASSHLLQEDETEYNFDFASQEFKGELPAVVNFCRREQGLVIAKGNPRGIQGISDIGQPGIRIANRPVGTGTRLLLDRELRKAGIEGERVEGYEREFLSHLEAGVEVLAGRADAAPAISYVASSLGLDFVPLRWERYDLLTTKQQFFGEGVQLFLGLLHESPFRSLAEEMVGYDLSFCGKVVFAQQIKKKP